MTDKCPVHDVLMEDLKGDIKDCKASINKLNDTSVDLYNRKVSNKLFYWIMGIGFTVLTIIGGIQINNQKDLNKSLTDTREVVVEIKVNQDNIKSNQEAIKSDVDSIKKHIKGRNSD